MYNAKYLMPQVNTDSLAAHYKMWDGLASTNRTFDYSLNGNLGSTTMITYGSYPGYLYKDGNQILCGSDASIDDIWDGGASFVGWLRPTSIGQNNAGQVYEKSSNLTNGTKIRCTLAENELSFTQVTDTQDGFWTFPFDITGDIWQHLVLTYDADTAAAGGAPTVYVNGETAAVTEVDVPNDTRTSDAGSDLYIGTRAAGGRSWNGKMDDLMFFDRTIGAAEAKSMFSVTRQRYGV